MSSRAARWARRTVRRRDRVPHLAQVLLGRGGPRYAGRRLGLPALRVGLTSALHALEAAALLLVFDPFYLMPILSLRIGSSISSAVVWGVGEGLRRDLRGHVAVGAHDAARQRFEAALGRALVLGPAIVVLTALWAWRMPWLGPGAWSVVDAYVVALGVQVGLGVMARTLAAGPGATRRIHRPPWSLLVPDLIDGLGLFLLWRWMGPWSVAGAVVLASVLQSGITGWFAWRALDGDRLRPLRVRLGRPTGGLVLRAAGLGLLGVTLALPSYLVWRGARHLGAGEVLLLLYVLRPAADLLQSVGRLYYVDHVRVAALGPALRRRLRAHVDRSLAVASAVLLALFLCGLALQRPEAHHGLVLAFWAVSVALAVLTSRVLERLVARPDRHLATSLVGVWVVAFGLGGLPLPPVVLLIGVGAAALLGSSVLGAAPPPDAPRLPIPDRPATLIAWIDGLPDAPCRIDVVEVPPPGRPRDVDRLARQLAASGRWVTRIGRRHLLVAGTPDAPRSERIAALGGLGRIRSVAEGPDRATALTRLRDDPATPRPVRDTLRPSPGPLEGVPIQASSGPEGRRGRLGEVSRAVAAASGGRPPASTRFGDFDLAVVVSDRGAEDVRLLPGSWSPDRRRRSRLAAWRHSVAAALARAGVRDAPARSEEVRRAS